MERRCLTILCRNIDNLRLHSSTNKYYWLDHWCRINRLKVFVSARLLPTWWSPLHAPLLPICFMLSLPTNITYPGQYANTYLQTFKLAPLHAPINVFQFPISGISKYQFHHVKLACVRLPQSLPLSRLIGRYLSLTASTAAGKFEVLPPPRHAVPFELADLPLVHISFENGNLPFSCMFFVFCSREVGLGGWLIAHRWDGSVALRCLFRIAHDFPYRCILFDKFRRFERERYEVCDGCVVFLRNVGEEKARSSLSLPLSSLLHSIPARGSLGNRNCFCDLIHYQLLKLEERNKANTNLQSRHSYFNRNSRRCRWVNVLLLLQAWRLERDGWMGLKDAADADNLEIPSKFITDIKLRNCLLRRKARLRS